MQSKAWVRSGDRQHVHDEVLDARADLLAEPGAATVPDLHDHQRPDATRDANQTRQVAQEPQGDASTPRATDYACGGDRLCRQPGTGTSPNSWRNWLIRLGVVVEFPLELEQRLYPKLSAGAGSAEARSPVGPTRATWSVSFSCLCREVACCLLWFTRQTRALATVAQFLRRFGITCPAFKKGVPIVSLSFGRARGKRKARRLATAG